MTRSASSPACYLLGEVARERGWPCFELYVFPEPGEIASLTSRFPVIRGELLTRGVPRDFIGRRYTADPVITLLQHEEDAPLLRFGSSGLLGAICVNLTSGHVVETIDTPRSKPRSTV